MSEEYTKIGCEIIITKGNKILLGKRKNHFGEGTWGLPGGHLEYGEKLIEAANRELFEELGIENVNLELVAIVDDPKDSGHYIHVSFLLDEYEGEIKLMEPQFCEGWEFVDIDDSRVEIFPPHVKIIETFKQKKLYLY